MKSGSLRFLRRMKFLSKHFATVLLGVCAVISAGRARAESLPLERAIRLALAHSTNSAIADADIQRSFAGFREIRNNYLPQINAGSGLGWTYGYPLALGGQPPALLDVVAQSSVFNLAEQQLLKAARTDWQAAIQQSKDQRQATIQDAALTYAELAKWETRLDHLQGYASEAQATEKAVSERLEAGVDSAVDLNKAKLAAARVRLHIAEAKGSADVLRQHLATLTGLPAASIEVQTESIPALPPLTDEADLAQKAVDSSPAVKSAERHSLAEAMRATAVHRASLPSIDFSGQYARFSTFNNYSVYFPYHFQKDNATLGFALRIPLFNPSQRAKADAADAEALKARKQAEATRNQMTEETLRLQRATEQLAAAREVAELEFQLAQSGLAASQTRVDAKTGTFHELADARVQAAERFLIFQNADFEYERARVGLLRATGDLEKWALPNSPAP